MNNKTINSFLYQFRDSLTAVIAYYLIFIAVNVLIFVITGITISENSIGVFHMNGVGIATLIFIFCKCAFKENFHMLTQNGVSRKSVYFGRIMTSVIFSFILAMVDMILKNVFGIIASMMGENFIYESLFDSMYYDYCTDKNAVVIFLINFLFFFVLFLCFNALGYLMSTVFYRLGKTAKIFFAAGIPTFIVLIYPLVDYTVFDGKISVKLIELFMKIFGITHQQPLTAVLSLIIGAVLFIALSWLPMRRARVE